MAKVNFTVQTCELGDCGTVEVAPTEPIRTLFSKAEAAANAAHLGPGVPGDAYVSSTRGATRDTRWLQRDQIDVDEPVSNLPPGTTGVVLDPPTGAVSLLFELQQTILAMQQAAKLSDQEREKKDQHRDAMNLALQQSVKELRTDLEAEQLLHVETRKAQEAAEKEAKQAKQQPALPDQDTLKQFEEMLQQKIKDLEQELERKDEQAAQQAAVTAQAFQQQITALKRQVAALEGDKAKLTESVDRLNKRLQPLLKQSMLLALRTALDRARYRLYGQPLHEADRGANRLYDQHVDRLTDQQIRLAGFEPDEARATKYANNPWQRDANDAAHKAESDIMLLTAQQPDVGDVFKRIIHTATELPDAPA